MKIHILSDPAERKDDNTGRLCCVLQSTVLCH